MRLILTLSKMVLFFGLAVALSAGSGYLLLGKTGAKVLITIVLWSCLWNAVTWKNLWVRELRAKRIQSLPSFEVFHVNDPSSHFFILKSPLGGGGVIFMTRGALSLLSPGELDALVNDSERILRASGSGWNTFISGIQLRLTRWIPAKIRPFFLGAPETGKMASLKETLLALPGLGLIDLLTRFLIRTDRQNPKIQEIIHKKLLAESFLCSPRINAAATVHSLIHPWPKALLKVGEPCLPEKTWLNSG